MVKFVIALAAAGTALAFATPAAAQYYPQPQPYGYNGYNQYGYNGYGNNNFGQVRALQVRIDALQNQIRRLDRRDAIRDGSADRLREESRNIEQRLHRAERYGLNGYEANDIQARIARLEQRVQYALASRYGRYGNGYNGYGHDGYDRDGDRDRDRDGDRDRD
jgi:opacity protein-like surface antigen